MKNLFKFFVALTTASFLSLPIIAKPVELHYWHGHTGKLENIINEHFLNKMNNYKKIWSIYILLKVMKKNKIEF